MLAAVPLETPSATKQKQSQQLPQQQHDIDELNNLTSCVQDLVSHIDKLDSLLGKSQDLHESSNAYADLVRSLDQAYDPFDTNLLHWCTLLRCLPRMNPVSQKYVRTVAMHAMRDLLELKRPSQPVCRPFTSSMSYLDRDESLDETTRKKADGWIPTHYSNSPSCNSLASTPASVAIHPSHSSTAFNDGKVRQKRWFRRYNKVAPDAAAISNWIKEKKTFHNKPKKSGTE